jgi:hypothetical protein
LLQDTLPRKPITRAAALGFSPKWTKLLRFCFFLKEHQMPTKQTPEVMSLVRKVASQRAVVADIEKQRSGLMRDLSELEGSSDRPHPSCLRDAKRAIEVFDTKRPLQPERDKLSELESELEKAKAQTPLVVGAR